MMDDDAVAESRVACADARRGTATATAETTRMKPKPAAFARVETASARPYHVLDCVTRAGNYLLDVVDRRLQIIRD